MFSSKRRIRYGGKREERQKQKMLCFFKQKQRIHLNRLREALQKEKEATKVTEEDLSSEHFVHLLRLKEERQQKSKNQPLFREGSPLFQIFGDTSTQSFDNLPFMQFEGKIDVIHCEKEESSHSSYLNNIRVVGVDTEAKPRIKPGKNNPVCLVQLATLDKAFIYRLKKGQILPPILKDIFANPEILKVSLW
jgi:ribonuclease D